MSEQRGSGALPDHLLFYIEDDWLNAVKGKKLFYPAAGTDTEVLIDMFAPSVRDFVFNDLFYSTRTDRRPVAPSRFRIVSEDRPLPIERDVPLEEASPERPWRSVSPSALVQSLSDGWIDIIVKRRRGFGQFALREMPERSIGVFVHRSDSIGESGSKMWFLANLTRRHEPLSNLWDKLATRLTDRAIIVSDGSLTRFPIPRVRNCADIKDEYDRARPISVGGFDWHCIGYTGSPRTSLIWGLTRIGSSPSACPA